MELVTRRRSPQARDRLGSLNAKTINARFDMGRFDLVSVINLRPKTHSCR